VNAVLNYLAARPAWAIDVAVYALFLGLWAATLIRAGEILRDEDMPLTPAPAGPVTLDLGLFGPNLDALENTS
jgi:hypothetical protein